MASSYEVIANSGPELTSKPRRQKVLDSNGTNVNLQAHLVYEHCRKGAPMDPLLSVIVICHNMRREAPRTLHSLSRRYQRGIADLDYEVLVVDNGSTLPLDEQLTASLGPEFRYEFYPTTSVSPVAAINWAVSQARGRIVAICLDGARIHSPGTLRYITLATQLSQRPLVATLAWHLGEKVQKLSMLEGYDQDAEDRLLASRDWQGNGYELFAISCLANSSGNGWFRPISESSCIALTHAMYDELGGFDPRFVTPGGGYSSIDFYKRACELTGSELIVLLGEGTFHQFHGGAATNARPEVHPGKLYAAEYQSLRGCSFVPAAQAPIYMGAIPAQAAPFLRFSAERLS